MFHVYLMIPAYITMVTMIMIRELFGIKNLNAKLKPNSSELCFKVMEKKSILQKLVAYKWSFQYLQFNKGSLSTLLIHLYGEQH